jgi:hypothetical protein
LEAFWYIWKCFGVIKIVSGNFTKFLWEINIRVKLYWGSGVISRVGSGAEMTLWLRSEFWGGEWS